MSKRLLLIEDNDDVRENTAEILELADFIVLTAENGKVGVKMAKEEKPDLIICDIMMPELDGYGVLHILGKNPETATIPFIFLTAKAEKSDMRKGMSLGADDYLTKPFEETDLMDAIESRLKRSDSLKEKFNQDTEGLNTFIQKARGISDIQSLASDKKNKLYKKKDIVFREGDYANSIFFVNKGKIKSFKINDDGKEFITALYQQGDFFGYTAVLEGIEYFETTMTLEDSELVAINKDEFLDLLYTNRDVANKFIQILSNNVREKEQELLDLAYNTVRKRVADALLKLKGKYQDDKKEKFEIAVSRSDLASIVGTAQESVIRFLSEFKDDGYIAIQGRKIIILKPEKLEELKF